MTTQKPRFLRVSLLYFCSTFLSKLAVFLLLPLYTAKIPTGDMGVFDTATAIAMLLAATLFCDVGIGVMQAYLAADGEKAQGAVLAAGLLQMGVSLLIYLPLGAVFAYVTHVPYGALAVLYGAANALLAAAGYFARARGLSLWYAAVSLLATLLQVGLNLLFLLVFDMGYEALYVSFIAATVLCALLLFWRAGAFCALRALPDCGAAFCAQLRFCLPLGISAAAYLVLTSGARVLTTLCLDAEAGGVVAIAMKLAQVAFVVGAVLRFVWQELCFTKGFDENGAGDRAYYAVRVSLLLRVILAGALLLVPLLRVWLWLFPSFIAPAYAEAARLLPVMLLGALLSVVADFLEPPLAMLKKTGAILLTCATGAALSVVTTLVLFKLGVGMWGAALGFCSGFLCVVLLRLVLLSRLLRVRVPRTIWALPTALVPVALYLWLPPIGSLLLLLILLPFCVFLLIPQLRLRQKGR